MNYIIWNGKDSREIKGLVVCELPPISKPLMRVAETFIDGVDGSMIEELGYEPYDKPLLIGLTQKADIDEVIKYFSGNGEVVFSNEADKYYKASIIGQVDYARLVRFRTATVTFRVQPFKYEYLEVEKSVTSKSIEGTHITFNSDNKKLLELGADGNNAQLEVETVGKNLFNKETAKVGYFINYNNGDCKDEVGLTASDFIKVKPNTKYYCNYVTFGSSNFGIAFYDENKEFISGSRTINLIETPANAKYFRFCFRNENYSSATSITDINTVQLEEGTVATEYQAYQKKTGLLASFEFLEGINHISNSENAKMILSYIDDDLIVINNGNYTSKPIVEISGAGEIRLSVNGNTLFRYTFPENEDTVVIDSQRQDAYFGAILKNRNMSGEFPILTTGENVITWDGVIRGLKITAKSRWL